MHLSIANYWAPPDVVDPEHIHFVQCKRSRRATTLSKIEEDDVRTYYLQT